MDSQRPQDSAGSPRQDRATLGKGLRPIFRHLRPWVEGKVTLVSHAGWEARQREPHRTHHRLGTRSTAKPRGQKSGGGGRGAHAPLHPRLLHTPGSQIAGRKGKRLVLLKGKCEATGLRCDRDRGERAPGHGGGRLRLGRRGGATLCHPACRSTGCQGPGSPPRPPCWHQAGVTRPHHACPPLPQPPVSGPFFDPKGQPDSLSLQPQ